MHGRFAAWRPLLRGRGGVMGDFQDEAGDRRGLMLVRPEVRQAGAEPDRAVLGGC